VQCIAKQILYECYTNLLLIACICIISKISTRHHTSLLFTNGNTVEPHAVFGGVQISWFCVCEVLIFVNEGKSTCFLRENKKNMVTPRCLYSTKPCHLRSRLQKKFNSIFWLQQSSLRDGEWNLKIIIIVTITFRLNVYIFRVQKQS
jgi:hypothetical protein